MFDNACGTSPAFASAVRSVQLMSVDEQTGEVQGSTGVPVQQRAGGGAVSDSTSWLHQLNKILRISNDQLND